MNAIKQFGLGIIYAVLFPLIVAVAAIIGVFGVINFFYQGILVLINFFKGKPIFPPYKEDSKAYEILQKAIDKQNGIEEKKETTAPTQTIYVQQNYYQQTPNGYIPQNQGNPTQNMNGFIQSPQSSTNANPPFITQSPAENNLPNGNVQLDQIPQIKKDDVIETSTNKNDEVELLSFPETEEESK